MNVGSAAAAVQSPEQDVQQAEQYVEQALNLAQQGKLNEANKSFHQYRDNWFKIEDGVRNESAKAYQDIEAAMGKVDFAFAQNKPADVVTALKQLEQVNEKFAHGQYGKQAFVKQDISLDDFVLLLQQTKADAAAGRIDQAVADIERVQESWLSVEGTVIAQSQTVYDNVERDMVTVHSLLTANPPDTNKAVTLLDGMVQQLSPLATKTGYTVFDAAMVPIREGLEALLVVAALLTVVRKSESRAGRTWVWLGVSIGLLVSAVLAVLVKWVFSSGAFGQNNFLIAGWTGVIAAAMLVYMSYWLHSKSQIADWQNYLHSKTQLALSTGKLVSLGLLSFLAVFREGTETVLFILGMANQIRTQDLILGLMLGIGLLAVLAYIMLVIGKRLPMRPFFLVSSLIVFYLSVKFTGLGIHSLQLAGVIPSTTLTIPSISFLALYPSWQSMVPQLLLVLAAVAVVVWRQWQHRKHVAPSQ
jgi:high-affinity iron transporter